LGNPESFCGESSEIGYEIDVPRGPPTPGSSLILPGVMFNCGILRITFSNKNGYALGQGAILKEVGGFPEDTVYL
jgi:hypothetical protein